MIELVRQLEWTHPLRLAALVLAVPILYFTLRSLLRWPWWLRGLALAVRLLLVALVVLALCGLRQVFPAHDTFVVLAIDQSQSITQSARQKADAFVDSAARSAPANRLAYLPFAGRPGVPSLVRPEHGTAPETLQSDLAAAIRLAQQMIPATCVPHIVLLSDGRPTRGDALATARAAGVPVSTVPLPGQPDHEVFITTVRVPDRVRLGEQFTAEVVVQSASDNAGTVRVDCRRADRVETPESLISAGVPPSLPAPLPSNGRGERYSTACQLSAGENVVRLTLAARQEGWLRCTARLEGFRDELTGNNELAAPLLVIPPPRVLLVEGQPGLGQRLAAALHTAAIETTVCAPARVPATVDALARYDLVAILNTPAAQLPAPWTPATEQYLRAGGGLLVVGGDHAFTPGLYTQTKFEDLLPVSSYSRDDKEKPTLALAIVIDQSGSMADEHRLDMAQEATRRAVELLSPRDQVGVLAFEDASHWVSSLRPGSEKEKTLAAVAQIKAEGATNMYPAMQRAYFALRDAFADRRHMILLTDGMAQAADFEQLARRMADDGITVSVLGLGREVPDQVLSDIARLGHGTYHRCPDAAMLPKIFVAETISAAQRGITEKPFVPQLRETSPLLAGVDAGHLPPLQGYVETRLKAGATLVLAAETGDPLLAWGRCDQGRSGVFTSSIDGHWAATWLDWPQFEQFWLQVVRYLMRHDDPCWQVTSAARSAQTPPPYAEELRVGPTDTKLLRAIAEASGGRFDPPASELFAPTAQSVPRRRPLWPLLLAAALPLFLADVTLRRIALWRRW